jgi:WD40 repeat protein
VGDSPLDATADGWVAIAQDAVLTLHDRLTADDSVLLGHEAPITAAVFLPGGKRLVSAARDGTLRIWKVKPPPAVVEMEPPAGSRWEGYATFVSGGKQVITAPRRNRFGWFDGKSVALYDAATGKRLRTVVNEDTLATSALHKQLLGNLRDLDISPDGTRLVTVHHDGNPCDHPKQEPKASPLYTPVRVWDLRSGKLLFALEGLAYRVAAARFSPDGKRLATAVDGTYEFRQLKDGTIYAFGTDGPRRSRIDLWNAETGKHLRNLVAERPEDSTMVVWSPSDGKRILTSPFADIYDTDSGAKVARLQKASFDHAAYSPDGKLILGYRTLTDHANELVEVYDAATGAQRFTLRGHTGNVTSAEFSHDSRLILTTSTDGTARLWDAATGAPQRVLRGHHSVVKMGRFSPNGQWIATASADGTARIWRTATGAEWLTLAHAVEYVQVEFSADSDRLLTVSSENRVAIWPVDPLPLGVARQPRELTGDERVRFQIGP